MADRSTRPCCSTPYTQQKIMMPFIRLVIQLLGMLLPSPTSTRGPDEVDVVEGEVAEEDNSLLFVAQGREPPLTRQLMARGASGTARVVVARTTTLAPQTHLLRRDSSVMGFKHLQHSSRQHCTVREVSQQWFQQSMVPDGPQASPGQILCCPTSLDLPNKAICCLKEEIPVVFDIFYPIGR